MNTISKIDYTHTHDSIEFCDNDPQALKELNKKVEQIGGPRDAEIFEYQNTSHNTIEVHNNGIMSYIDDLGVKKEKRYNYQGIRLQDKKHALLIAKYFNFLLGEVEVPEPKKDEVGNIIISSSDDNKLFSIYDHYIIYGSEKKRCDISELSFLSTKQISHLINRLRNTSTHDLDPEDEYSYFSHLSNTPKHKKTEYKLHKLQSGMPQAQKLLSQDQINTLVTFIKQNMNAIKQDLHQIGVDSETIDQIDNLQGKELIELIPNIELILAITQLQSLGGENDMTHNDVHYDPTDESTIIYKFKKLQNKINFENILAFGIASVWDVLQSDQEFQERYRECHIDGEKQEKNIQTIKEFFYEKELYFHMPNIITQEKLLHQITHKETKDVGAYRTFQELFGERVRGILKEIGYIQDSEINALHDGEKGIISIPGLSKDMSGKNYITQEIYGTRGLHYYHEGAIVNELTHAILFDLYGKIDFLGNDEMITIDNTTLSRISIDEFLSNVATIGYEHKNHNHIDRFYFDLYEALQYKLFKNQRSLIGPSLDSIMYQYNISKSQNRYGYAHQFAHNILTKKILPENPHLQEQYEALFYEKDIKRPLRNFIKKVMKMNEFREFVANTYLQEGQKLIKELDRKDSKG